MTTTRTLVSELSGTGTMVKAARAAEMLGLTMFALRAWRYLGVGPKWVRISASHVSYPVEEILAVIEGGGVHGVCEARRAKKAGRPLSPTPASVRAALACRVSAIARRRRVVKRAAGETAR